MENTTIRRCRCRRRPRRRFFFLIESTRIQGCSLFLYCQHDLRRKEKPRSSVSGMSRSSFFSHSLLSRRENSNNGRERLVEELPYTFFFDHSINPENDIRRGNTNYLTDISSSSNDNN